MFITSFFHTLQDGTEAKFKIYSHLIDGELFYFAKVINSIFLSEEEKLNPSNDFNSGIAITNGNQQKIYYRDPQKLITDIVAYYGNNPLETEK